VRRRHIAHVNKAMATVIAPVMALNASAGRRCSPTQNVAAKNMANAAVKAASESTWLSPT
jgi:hypothetical protein